MRGRGGEGNVWAENRLVVHSLHPIYRIIYGYYWNNGQKGPSRGLLLATLVFFNLKRFVSKQRQRIQNVKRAGDFSRLRRKNKKPRNEPPLYLHSLVSYV